MPVAGDDNYVAGVYVNGGWTAFPTDLSTVDEVNDSIKFPTLINSGMSIIEGDYTAGASDAFNNVLTFYSRQTGNWNSNTTWSNISVGGAACPAGTTPGVSIPGPSNPVIIGGGSNHTITVPAGLNNITTGSLQINAGSVLDLTSTTGHNFGSIPDRKVTGNGRLRISSPTGGSATAEFPRGDFGLFLNDMGGTVEYYSTAALGATILTIPAVKADAVSLTSYKNLVLSAHTGKSIIMPNSNLQVYGNLEINGTTTGVARLSTNTNSYTVTVRGNMLVNSGTFQYPNTNGWPQYVTVDSNVVVNSAATLNVNSNNRTVANTLTISGNITNNGAIDMHPAANPFCNLIFLGNNNNVFNGTTATLTRLNAITIDKGTSRNSVLDVTVNNAGFSLNTALTNALTLTNGTFRLTTNTAINLSTADFTIPTTGCISANGGTFNLCSANDDAFDLFLNGRLEVLAGAINVGTPTNTSNNDIEYASAGTPEIIVRGGALNVVGQIRRSTIIETGSLNYTQTGGQVNIIGRNALNARSMFEVLNSASTFRMGGGTLTLVRNFNNAAYNDLYIMPDTSDVTGGTIQLGTTDSPASQFNVVLSSPVWNLTIDGTTNPKTVNLRVSSLEVLNDLTIGNPAGVNSALITNGLNVFIGHNLYNYNTDNGTTISTGGFQATSATQQTTFNGSANQLITGRGTNVTNFANLRIANPGPLVTDSLASNTTIRVNGNLDLTTGILADGNNNITVTGNINNTGIHRSSGASNGITLTSTQKQFISGDGNGIFGNVTVNNANGVDLLDNSTINGRLTLASGLLYVDDMLLTLGANANIGGTPGATNMIRLNGALSDLGVRKVYPSGSSVFTFPIGITGKYTPATLNISSNTYTGASSITVKPVNGKHPATYELPASVTNELQYYWNVISSGFNNGATVTHTYNYSGADALPDETGYVAARYQNFLWTMPAEGTVNTGTDQIIFNNFNYIDGEYTCGVNTNFQNLQTLYSRTATAGLPAGASWDLASSWTVNSDGSGDPAPYVPSGNPVVILPGHKINAVSDGNKSYSILLNGTLNLAATVNHSHGHVNGNGTLIIGSTPAGYFVFPGGEYDEFMNTTGTVVEYFSNINATLPNSIGTVYKPYQNLRFTGSGTKYLASVNMKVRGYLTIQNGFLSNSKADKNIYLLGDWIDAVNSGFIAGKGSVSFEGTSAQHTTINTLETFYQLQINNALGNTFTGAGSNTVRVSKFLNLTKGNIYTGANHMLHITNNSISAVIGGSNVSFVDGPMRKTIDNGSFFNFPVGDDSRLGKVLISDITSSGVLEAEYYNFNPYNASSKIDPIDTVTTKEHWRVNFPGIANGNVLIRWDNQSDIIPLTAVGRTKLRNVEWNSTAWFNQGGIVNGSLSAGTIRTNPVVNLNGNHYFTIGLESLPTANIISGNTSICDNGVDAATVQVELTGTAPWTLKYEIDGANEQTINNIGSSPASVVLNSASAGFSGPATYHFNISFVSDATGSAGIRDFVKQVAITVDESPTPDITGKNPVSQNETSVHYKITGGTGHTYSWNVTGGSITAGQGTNEITVTWGSGSAGQVSVTETITATGCDVSDIFDVTINPAPSPAIVGTNSVCLQSSYTYQTGAAPSHQFTWTVVGGSINGGDGDTTAMGLSSIQVLWESGATGSVTVVETILSPLGTGNNTMDVTIHSLPENRVVTDPTICLGGTAFIILEDGEAGMDYTLRLNSDNSVVDFVHTTAFGDVTLEANPGSQHHLQCAG